MMKKRILRILFVLLWLLAAVVLAVLISVIVCKSFFCTRDYTVAIDGIDRNRSHMTSKWLSISLPPRMT